MNLIKPKAFIIPFTIFLHGFTGTPLKAGTFDAARLAEGIDVWRNTTDAKGRSCVDCHGSPDGFDMAYWNLTEADILRRDADHISPADSGKIVGLIEELRKKYDIVPEDIRNQSPFQPGGSVLPGATSNAKDAVFMNSLQSALPILAAGNVVDAATAQQAVQEILTLDIKSLPVGIELPRWSLDRHHGDSDGRLTDWIADVAVIPKTPAAREQYHNDQDTYLADPTEANFWKMFESSLRNTSVQEVGMTDKGKQFMRDKYMASMIGSHDLRMETLGLPRILDKKARHTHVYFDTSVSRERRTDPIFALGEAAQNPSEVFQFPLEVANSLDPLLDQTEHVRHGKDPWWWMGWMYNPGLMNAATRHEYFPNSLLNGNFQFDPVNGRMPTHAKYMTTITDVYNYRLPDPTNRSARVYYYSMPGNKLAPFNPTPTFFATNAFDPDQQPEYFFDATHRAQHVKFACNVAKMRLYMIKEDLQEALANGRPYWNIHGFLTSTSRESLGTHDFLEAQRQLAQYDPANVAHNDALITQVRDLMRDLKNGATAPVQGNGTGLSAHLFSDQRLINPLATRIDPSVHFYPGVGNAPGAVYPATDISVRWTGYLQPRYTDTYKFNALFPDAHTGLGGVRIWVNGTLLYDKWNAHVDFQDYSSTIALVAGEKYPFVVEYKQGGAFQQISVRWESPKELNDVIPPSQLYPAELPVEQVTAVIDPVADAYVRGSQYGNTNYGASSEIQAWGAKPTSQHEQRNVFLKFPVTGLSGPAAKAELSLILKEISSVDANGTNPAKLEVYLVEDDSWTELGVTMNTQPALGSKLGEVADVARLGYEMRVDITDAVNAQRLGDGVITLAVVQPSGMNKFTRLHSREAGANGPRIILSEMSTPVPATYGDWSVVIPWGDIPVGGRGAGNDPDGDGRSNRLERALGTDPTKADLPDPANYRMEIAQSALAGGQPMFTVHYQKLAPDETYELVHGTDLQNVAGWTSGGTIPEQFNPATGMYFQSWTPAPEDDRGFAALRLISNL